MNRQKSVALSEAVGRVLAEGITGGEYVPDFDLYVDGFADSASDTFGLQAMPSRRS